MYAIGGNDHAALTQGLSKWVSANTLGDLCPMGISLGNPSNRVDIQAHAVVVEEIAAMQEAGTRELVDIKNADTVTAGSIRFPLKEARKPMM